MKRLYHNKKLNLIVRSTKGLRGWGHVLRPRPRHLGFAVKTKTIFHSDGQQIYLDTFKSHCIIYIMVDSHFSVTFLVFKPSSTRLWF